MNSEKRFTAAQAALAVLAKVQEICKESPLAKSYEGFKAVEESARKGGASDPAAVAASAGREKYGKEAFQHAAAEGKKMSKYEENPDEKQDAELGEKVEHEVEAHEVANPEAEKQEHREKGPYKLAKFMGAMDAKRGKRPGSVQPMDKAEGEKGVHLDSSDPKGGTSNAGSMMATHNHSGKPGMLQGAKDQHKKVLSQMQQMPKPKLPG